jgi:hypothetical protein
LPMSIPAQRSANRSIAVPPLVLCDGAPVRGGHGCEDDQSRARSNNPGHLWVASALPFNCRLEAPINIDVLSNGRTAYFSPIRGEPRGS